MKSGVAWSGLSKKSSHEVGFGAEDHLVAFLRDVHLLALEPVLRGQAHGLAAAVHE